MMRVPVSHSMEVQAGLQSTISPQQNSTMLQPIPRFLTGFMPRNRITRLSVCPAARPLLALRNRTRTRLEVARAAILLFVQIIRTLYLQEIIMAILPVTTINLGSNVILLSGLKQRLVGVLRRERTFSKDGSQHSFNFLPPLCFIYLLFFVLFNPR